MQIAVGMKAEAADYPSRYSIGTVVYFYPDMWCLRPEVADTLALKGRIDKVQFSGSKVTYDLAMQCADSDTHGNVTGNYFYDAITVKDVDSTFVSTFEDIVAEWERSVRITREGIERKLRDANRRLADLAEGRLIPDNWYLDANDNWCNPADQTLEEVCPLAPAPVIEATAGEMFPAVRAMFEELFAKLKQRKLEQAAQNFYDGVDELRVKWKEEVDGCA